MDRLTGARDRSALQERINLAILAGDPTPFVARFLCVDIDNFKAYLDVEGLSAGDEVLAALGRALVDHFGADTVYRVGSDDFVVELGDRAAWVPAIAGIAIKHAVLEVAVRRNRARNHHVCKWIMMHLDGASLSARAGGVALTCGDPPLV